MKVLFAVNSESVSDAIIKKYQKDYREILSYKNVYYFNAILKEIQQDKSYDRIVISEDLEPFSNNNYESIDKFIFEKLDGISDEAHDSMGNEISIILICSDRHQKGSSFLVKLFGIGVYNALLGSDRSMEEVCRLIKKPRTKKEAKMYYRIDTDDVNYRAENENEVSELEIQNIIAHFKKLGKNTAKFASSFENIASQYTDEQLKIIINCLPINVKATLEETSDKYQQIMSVNGGLVKGVKSTSTATRQDQKRTGLKIDIIENKMRQQKMTQPIVIPNSVKATKSATAKKVVSIQQQPAQQQPVQNAKPKQPEVKSQPNKTKVERKQEPSMEQPKKSKLEPNQKIVEKLVRLPDGRVVKKKVIQKQKVAENEEVKKAVPQNKVVKPERKAVETPKEIDPFDELENLELPDLGTTNNSVSNKTLLNEETAEKTKRGRGRPRKTPIQDAIKPKGKRGRPRKTPEPEIVEDDEIEDPILQNEQLDLDSFEDNNLMAELNNEEVNSQYDEFVGNDDDDFVTGEDYSAEVDLPELDELDDIDDFDDDDSIGETEESFDEFDEYDEYGQYETKAKAKPEEIDDLYSEDILEEPVEVEDEEDFELEDVLDSDEDDLIPGFEDEEDDLLSDLDENDFEDEDNLLLSDDDDFEQIISDDETIEDGGYDSETEYKTTGDFDYTDNEYETTGNFNYEEDNSLESIKPSIDYSMSNLSSLMTKENKIVTFVGSPKNGVSFLVNNLAELFSTIGINTAVLDMTKNKNSYYIYTQNDENLRKIAYNSMENLQNGVAQGIKVKNNLTVYTSLPSEEQDLSNAEPILSTLVQNHSLILVDCDFETNPSYFGSSQEIYLVQSMDILTIQPLTAFLRELKTQGVLEPEKVKVVINKEVKVRDLTNKMIIGGISFYNDPAMAFMTELFNKDIVPYYNIPFEEMVYSKYLESIFNCKISINGYSKNFMDRLKKLGESVYPTTSRPTYSSKQSQAQNYGQNNFSNSMNDTLNKMKKRKF